MPSPEELPDDLGERAIGASLAPDNPTYGIAVKQGVSAFLMSPRMWPFGYILESSYSPLLVEEGLPGTHWRKAFEDLLALENGRDVMNEDNRCMMRDAERECFRNNLVDRLYTINEDTRIGNRLQALYGAGVGDPYFREARMSEVASMQDELQMKGQGIRARIQQLDSPSEKSSTEDYKSRLEWLTSLVSNTVVAGWQSTLGFGQDSLCMAIRKDEDEKAFIGFSAEELNDRIDNNKNYGVDSEWKSLQDDPPPYPGIAYGLEMEDMFQIMGSVVKAPRSLPSSRSLIRQVIRNDSSTSHTTQEKNFIVHLTNHFTDGSQETKKIDGNTRQVWREISNAYRELGNFVGLRCRETSMWKLEMIEEQTKSTGGSNVD